MTEENMIMTEEVTVEAKSTVIAGLPSGRALLQQSWQTFRAHWKKWLGLILTPYLFFLLYFASLAGAVGLTGEVSGFDAMAWWQIGLMIMGFISLIMALVVSIAVSLAFIKGAAEPSRSYKQLLRDGFSYFWSAVWIIVLLALIFSVVVVIGFGLSFVVGYVSQSFIIERAWLVYLLTSIVGLIFVLPLATLVIKLMFALQAMVLDDQKGRAALKYSNALTRGWWWSIAWRVYVVVMLMLIFNLLSFAPYLSLPISLVIIVVLAPIMTFYQIHLYQALSVIKATASVATESWRWYQKVGVAVLWPVSFGAVFAAGVALSIFFYGAQLSTDFGDDNFSAGGLSSDEYVDTDGDRLPDNLEGFFGTDPNNPDTDGDGVSDFDEALSQYIQDGDLTADSAPETAVTP